MDNKEPQLIIIKSIDNLKRAPYKGYYLDHKDRLFCFREVICGEEPLLTAHIERKIAEKEHVFYKKRKRKRKNETVEEKEQRIIEDNQWRFQTFAEVMYVPELPDRRTYLTRDVYGLLMNTPCQ